MTANTHDFQYDVLAEVAHRPWPMPASPWIMTQTWRDLLFAHWPVEASALRACVPAPLEVEQFDGSAWLSIVPFEMTNVAPRLIPALPGLSAFPEINVRTYVSLNGRPGVWFFSLDTTNAFAVWTARTMFHLPYYAASIDVAQAADGTIDFHSRRRAGEAAFHVVYAPAGPAAPAIAGSLDYFLTERYCLYTTDAHDRVLRVDIHHPPWPLQPARAEIRMNTLTEASGIAPPACAPRLHFSKRQDVISWPIEVCEGIGR